MIVWHVLHDQTEYRELGHDYFTRRDNPEATARRLIHDLQGPGHAGVGEVSHQVTGPGGHRGPQPPFLIS